MNFPQNILRGIQKHLTFQKGKIEANLKSLNQQDPFSDPDRLIDNAASDTDAKEESSHERMEALVKEIKRQVVEIEDTLIRIKNNTYGKCADCKKMIDTDRLAVKPTARYCFDCEKKREK